MAAAGLKSDAASTPTPCGVWCRCWSGRKHVRLGAGDEGLPGGGSDGHLRIIPDYCSLRGMLALGGNETTPNNDNNAGRRPAAKQRLVRQDRRPVELGTSAGLGRSVAQCASPGGPALGSFSVHRV